MSLSKEKGNNNANKNSTEELAKCPICKQNLRVQVNKFEFDFEAMLLVCKKNHSFHNCERPMDVLLNVHSESELVENLVRCTPEHYEDPTSNPDILKDLPSPSTSSHTEIVPSGSKCDRRRKQSSMGYHLTLEEQTEIVDRLNKFKRLRRKGKNDELKALMNHSNELMKQLVKLDNHDKDMKEELRDKMLLKQVKKELIKPEANLTSQPAAGLLTKEEKIELVKNEPKAELT